MVFDFILFSFRRYRRKAILRKYIFALSASLHIHMAKFWPGVQTCCVRLKFCPSLPSNCWGGIAQNVRGETFPISCYDIPIEYADKLLERKLDKLEYPHIAEDPVIGNKEKLPLYHFIALLVCHEYAHSVQHTAPVAFIEKWKRECTPNIPEGIYAGHGPEWQHLYRMFVEHMTEEKIENLFSFAQNNYYSFWTNFVIERDDNKFFKRNSHMMKSLPKEQLEAYMDYYKEKGKDDG